MSVWGALPIENDDAADWLSEFVEAPSIIALNEAFDDVLKSDTDSYREITECSVAVVAAAVVAELFGCKTLELLEKDALALLKSLSKMLSPGARVSLTMRAIESVRLVALETEHSELLQIMQENSKVGKVWVNNMNNLLQDLLEILNTLSAL